MNFSNMKTNRLRIRGLRAGMTMIELLVAVTILSVLMLAFGKILSKSQQVITASQMNMNANANATTIAQVLRDDIKKATQNGFICITTAPDGLTPRLVISTAGMVQSKTSAQIGSAGISVYGLDTDESLLCRQGWVLAPNATAGGDIWTQDFSAIQKLDRNGLNSLVDSLLNAMVNAFNNSDFTKEPETLAQVNALWPVLCSDVTKLSILWTDGTKETINGSLQLKWYGRCSNGGTSYNDIPKTAGSTAALPLLTPLPIDGFEFRHNNKYRALWTKYNQAAWPKAIKISFTVADKSLTSRTGDEEENKYQNYEIVIPVRP